MNTTLQASTSDIQHWNTQQGGTRIHSCAVTSNIYN